MDKYSISQNPGSKSKKSAAKKRSKAPARKQSKSFDPKLAIIAVIVVLVLILGGVVLARFFNKSSSDVPASNTGKVDTTKRAGESGIVPGETFAAVTTAISDKKPGDLNKYYAKRVRVYIPKQSINSTLNKDQVEGIIKNPLNTAETPWNWQISPEDLAAWQNGPYADEFVGNVIVGISADNTVIVIHIDENGQIDSIFIIPASELTPPAQSTSDTPAPTPDTPTDTPSTPTPQPTEVSD
jgi:hypothetical protein